MWQRLTMHFTSLCGTNGGTQTVMSIIRVKSKNCLVAEIMDEIT
jgi:hypothetical protein